MHERQVNASLRQRCLAQIESGGLTKDLEASYIQAYASLTLAEHIWWLVEWQEQTRQAANQLAKESGILKKGKS